MNGNYTFFYVEANLFCVVLFVIMLVRSLLGVDNQIKQRFFNIVLLCHICYFINDSLWILIMNEYLPKNRITVSFANLLNAIYLLGLACLFYIYIELEHKNPKLEDKKIRNYIQLPAIVFSILHVILFLFFNKTMIDDELNVTIFYYGLFVLIPTVYLMMACVRSIMRAFDPQNIAYRAKYLATSLYCIGVFVFGIIQTMGLQIPLFCFGLTINMVYLYLVSLDDLISIDPLTGLNNRAQLNRYVSQEIQHSDPEKKEHSVIMLDLNGFKSINDIYGHMEGDKALVKASNIIKTTCGNDPLRPFIARYGGDEFIIICKTDNEEDVVRLIKNIQKAFKEANDKSETLYSLSAAIGFASFKGTINSYQKAVERADKRLYLNKEDYYEAQLKNGK